VTSQDIREIIRADIGFDNPSDETYDDPKLNIFIKSALSQLAFKVGLSISISDGVFSTDPDQSQSALILLQTECIIATRERYQAIKKSVRVKQDENSIDTSTGLGPFSAAVAGKGGVCEMLEKAIVLYNSGVSAAAVYGENIWSGNSNLYEDADHNGQGFERIFRPWQKSFQNRDTTGGSATPLDQNRFTED
jgi:hypothetical protein